MYDLQQYSDFDSAAGAVLELLHKRVGLSLWMMTRTEGEDWIVLQAEDHGYGVQKGAVFQWAESLCSQMVLGLGPCVAPNVASVPAYAAAPIRRKVEIGAYIGVPLILNDGSLFGTLCAIDPIPQPETLINELPLVQVLARLLCNILESELKAADHARRAEQALAEAMTDCMTGLYNRRGWDRLLAAEEARCARYGDPACVISIDLDGLKQINDTYGHSRGDELIRLTGQTIRAAVRKQDTVARVGGDEFLVLAVECDLDSSLVLHERISSALIDAKINASIGIALRDPSLGLSKAVERADLAMYGNKKLRPRSRFRHRMADQLSPAEERHLCLK